MDDEELIRRVRQMRAERVLDQGEHVAELMEDLREHASYDDLLTAVEVVLNELCFGR